MEAIPPRSSKVVSVLVIIGLLVAIGVVAASSSSPPIVRRSDVPGTVVSVRSFNSNGLVHSGGGVILGRGRVLTAYHLVRGASWVICSSESGEAISATFLIYSDPRSDLAVLSSGEFPPGSKRSPAVFSSAQVGNEVSVYMAPGWPDARPVKGGRVRKALHPTGRTWTYLLAESAGRAVSGSPVLDTGGVPIGIVTKAYPGSRDGWVQVVASIPDAALEDRPGGAIRLTDETTRVFGDSPASLVRVFSLQTIGRSVQSASLLMACGEEERKFPLYSELEAYRAFEAGDWALARTHAEEAVRRGGRSWWALCILGMAMERSGDLDRAVSTLKASIQKRDELPELEHGYHFEPWATLASVYEALGKSVEAQIARTKAMEISPEMIDEDER
jgi:hypothetical protein